MAEKIKFDWTVRVDTVVLFVTLLVSAGIFYEKTENTRRDLVALKAQVAQSEKENNESHMQIVRTLSATAAIIDTHLKNGSKL